MPETDALLTRADTLKRLPVSERTLDRLLTSGRLRSLRVGQRRFIPARELDRFLADQFTAEVPS